jgi:hypothetical protein
MDIERIDRRGTNLDQHLVIAGRRLLDVLAVEDVLRRAVLAIDDGSHIRRPRL